MQKKEEEENESETRTHTHKHTMFIDKLTHKSEIRDDGTGYAKGEREEDGGVCEGKGSSQQGLAVQIDRFGSILAVLVTTYFENFQIFRFLLQYFV